MIAAELASSASAIAAAVRDRTVSARAVAEHFLDRIQAIDPRIRAFVTVNPEQVLRAADEIDQRVAAGDRSGALLGVPVAVKDNLCTTDHPTTCGSRILADYRPPHEATVVERLRAAGAVVLGKTNLDEFAMGASTENSGWFPTRNPHDLERVPGGSSGGSAAAVAAGLAPLALGSDTGGSVRQPAALCGVVGLRPTYGLVSRFGLVAFASSLDQVGPLALGVEDATLLFEVIAGPDPRDSTCLPEPVTALPAAEVELTGLRIGVPLEYDSDGVDPEVREAMASCRRLLEEAGARVRPVSLSLTEVSIPAYYLVVMSEASANLARFDGVRYGPRAETDQLYDLYAETRAQGFGDEVKRRIMLGTFALSAGYQEAYYKRALQVRRRIADEFEAAFAEVDFLLGPTSPTPAFRIGEKVDDPLALYLCDVFTAAAPLAGLPALSLPAGGTANGLPIGAQLQGPRRSDRRLLALARELERRLGTSCTPVEVDRGA